MSGAAILLLGVFLSLTALLAIYAARGRKRDAKKVTEPECASCRYPVRGLPTFICPECGSDLREVGITPPSMRRRTSGLRYLAAGAVCLFLALVGIAWLRARTVAVAQQAVRAATVAQLAQVQLQTATQRAVEQQQQAALEQQRRETESAGSTQEFGPDGEKEGESPSENRASDREPEAGPSPSGASESPPSPDESEAAPE